MSTTSGAPVTLSGVWDYYTDMGSLLDQLSKMMRTDRHAGVPEKFRALTPKEATERLSEIRDELNAQVSMMIVSVFDAAVRTDFARRRKRGEKKNRLSNSSRRRAKGGENHYRRARRFETF